MGAAPPDRFFTPDDPLARTYGARRMAETGYHVLPDGHRLYWRADDFTDPWKAAPTVLLIHGFAETGEAWRPWVPHLARDCRVLRIDRRGFGRSDPMPADFAWSLDRMVGDTVSFIEAHAAE